MKLNIDICIPSKFGVDPSLIAILRDETKGSIHISTKEGLVPARIDLIKKVKTSLFLFLDDDILYPKNHLRNLTSYFGASIGAVQGCVHSYGMGDKWDSALQKSLKTIKYDADRLFGSNMLIRTSLVKDWKPALNLSGCEDWDLTNHIRNKGYDCIIVPSKIKHKRSWLKTTKNASWFGKSYPNMFKKFPLSYFLKLYLVIGKSILLFPSNPRLYFYICYQNIFIISGMILNRLKKSSKNEC